MVFLHDITLICESGTIGESYQSSVGEISGESVVIGEHLDLNSVFNNFRIIKFNEWIQGSRYLRIIS